MSTFIFLYFDWNVLKLKANPIPFSGRGVGLSCELLGPVRQNQTYGTSVTAPCHVVVNGREKTWGLAVPQQTLFLQLKCCHQWVLELQRAVSLCSSLHCTKQPLYTQAALITSSVLPCQGSTTVLAVSSVRSIPSCFYLQSNSH